MMLEKSEDCGVDHFAKGYGCWCGRGNSGQMVMDEFDEACKGSFHM